MTTTINLKPTLGPQICLFIEERADDDARVDGFDYFGAEIPVLFDGYDASGNPVGRPGLPSLKLAVAIATARYQVRMTGSMSAESRRDIYFAAEI